MPDDEDTCAVALESLHELAMLAWGRSLHRLSMDGCERHRTRRLWRHRPCVIGRGMLEVSLDGFDLDHDVLLLVTASLVSRDEPPGLPMEESGLGHDVPLLVKPLLVTLSCVGVPPAYQRTQTVPLTNRHEVDYSETSHDFEIFSDAQRILQESRSTDARQLGRSHRVQHSAALKRRNVTLDAVVNLRRCDHLRHRRQLLVAVADSQYHCARTLSTARQLAAGFRSFSNFSTLSPSTMRCVCLDLWCCRSRETGVDRRPAFDVCCRPHVVDSLEVSFDRWSALDACCQPHPVDHSKCLSTAGQHWTRAASLAQWTARSASRPLVSL